MVEVIYKIYRVGIHRNGPAETFNVLINTNQEFTSEQEAQMWIENNGVRHTAYTVLKVMERR